LLDEHVRTLGATGDAPEAGALMVG